ncbi:hypothetical protein [Mesorhizobium sp. M1409]|uniref:hypothetical protein n=1 Tax=unclassified Mesorhizobium TaxID=325217 RepID=UPI00333880B9
MTIRWLKYTGLVVPPLAWALNTQLGQVTPYTDCQRNGLWTAISCGILLLVSVAGVMVSRALSTGTAKSERFIADAGFLIALAFVFALSLQGAATVLLDPCQR